MSRSLAKKTPQPIPDEHVAKLRVFMQRFVYESEGIGCSHQTGGFVKDLTIDRTERAASFFNKLISITGVSSAVAKSKTEIAKLISSDTNPTNSPEVIRFITNSKSEVTNEIEGLKEFRKTSPMKNGRRKQVKQRFYELDSLLRHLRNGFAHGLAKPHTSPDGNVRWTIQDRSPSGDVTAYFNVKEETLLAWVNILNERDRRYRLRGGRRKMP